MKKILTIILCAITFTSGFAQTGIVKGGRFDFDTKTEQEPQVLLKDNYNHYLCSFTNTVGMLASHKIIIRKFDQKNQLVDTYTQDFSLNLFTLHNVHGTYEIDNNKVVTFVESYYGKEKKSEIFKYVFDKTTAKFTSEIIATYPILSNIKSGSLSVSRSENGKYLSLVYQKYSAKKEPEESDCILLDAKTLNTVFHKTVSFQDEFYTSEKIVTNTGKIVFLRTPKSYKETNYLTVIDVNGQENKTFEENTKIHKPLAVSINDQDYLIAFNYRTKGIRRGDFGNIMFYDLNQGKVLNNNEIEGFNSVKDIEQVNFRYTFMQNNEIHVFVEGKYKEGTKPSVDFPNNPAFTDPRFVFGPANLLVFGYDGVLKQNTKLLLENKNNEAEFYHSFGVVNIKGEYFINTGIYYKNNSHYYGFYKLDASNKYAATILNLSYDLISDHPFKSVNQIVYYNVDKNQLVLARVFGDSQMSLVSVPMN